MTKKELTEQVGDLEDAVLDLQDRLQRSAKLALDRISGLEAELEEHRRVKAHGISAHVASRSPGEPVSVSGGDDGYCLNLYTEHDDEGWRLSGVIVYGSTGIPVAMVGMVPAREVTDVFDVHDGEDD